MCFDVWKQMSPEAMLRGGGILQAQRQHQDKFDKFNKSAFWMLYMYVYVVTG